MSAGRALAAAIVLAMALLGATSQPGADQPPTSPDPMAAGRCFEDDACFDCSTMGNRLCGPVPEWGAVRP